MTPEAGLKKTDEELVTPEKTAAHVASGTLEVYATPEMVRFMEQTAMLCVSPCLEQGQSTVGSSIDVQHLSPTPVGLTVRCEAELVLIDRKRLVFDISVFDSSGLIGKAKHERFIVDNVRFMDKAKGKL